MSDEDLFAVVANLREADGALRVGAKCWLIGGENGDGGERRMWSGLSIGGRRITKWAPTKRFQNFRAAWVPLEIRAEFQGCMGTRAEMERWAALLNERHPAEQNDK